MGVFQRTMAVVSVTLMVISEGGPGGTTQIKGERKVNNKTETFLSLPEGLPNTWAPKHLISLPPPYGNYEIMASKLCAEHKMT